MRRNPPWSKGFLVIRILWGRKTWVLNQRIKRNLSFLTVTQWRSAHHLIETGMTVLLILHSSLIQQVFIKVSYSWVTYITLSSPAALPFILLLLLFYYCYLFIFTFKVIGNASHSNSTLFFAVSAVLLNLAALACNTLTACCTVTPVVPSWYGCLGGSVSSICFPSSSFSPGSSRNMSRWPPC